MFKLKYLATAVLAGTAFVSMPALAADSSVAGTWSTEAKMGDNSFKSTWTVSQSGAGYAVNIADAPMAGAPADAPPPKSTISDVAVDGNTLTFKRHLEMGDMPIDIDYKVTADGNALTGSAHTSFGDLPITGTRQ